MPQLADFSLKAFEVLHAGNRNKKDSPLYYSKRKKKGVVIIITGCVDLPEGHGVGVS